MITSERVHEIIEELKAANCSFIISVAANEDEDSYTYDSAMLFYGKAGFTIMMETYKKLGSVIKENFPEML